MPIYEYDCPDCRHRVSLLWRSIADSESRQAVCPRCGGTRLRRVMSRVAVVRSEAPQTDSGAGAGLPEGLPDGVDENDPKSLARWMRKMSSETGEDLGPEFDEVVGRLEAGEDPDEIEKSMPDPGGSGGGDDFGVM